MSTSPTTKIGCPSCQAVYEIDYETLSAQQKKQGRLRCSVCHTIFDAASAKIIELAAQTAEEPKPERRFGIPDPEPEPEPEPVQKVELQESAEPTKIATPTPQNAPKDVPRDVKEIKPTQQGLGFERKDPHLDFSRTSPHRTSPPRKVGFVAEASSTSYGTETLSTESKPDPLMERIESQIQNAADRGEKRHKGRFWTSLVVILLFFALLTALTVWILREQPEWATPSYWFAESSETLNEDKLIEDDIRALPLEKPSLSGQTINIQRTDDPNLNQLDLAAVIRNDKDYAIRLESLRAISLDVDGNLKRSWTFSPGARTLSAGEVLPFSNQTPIAVGQREVIKFGWQSDIAKLPEVQETELQ